MKITEHAGDCDIYSRLENGNPEDGICTCGYGLQERREGDRSKMYSRERVELEECDEFNELVLATTISIIKRGGLKDLILQN